MLCCPTPQTDPSIQEQEFPCLYQENPRGYDINSNCTGQHTMSKIFLFGFSCLFIFTVAQGLVCKYCSSTDAVTCNQENMTCTPRFGRCLTKSFYKNTKKGARFDGVTYGCIDTPYQESFCGTVHMSYDQIKVTTCCYGDRCNGNRAPFPPPNC